MAKKGFTLMEVLVVILIVAVIISLYQITHRNAQIVRANERARAMFVEFTNAARLFNEMYPATKVYGGFGDTNAQSLGYLDPCNLFLGYFADQEVQDNIQSYALRPQDWGLNSAGACGNGLQYEGYTFVLCNPSFDSDAPQPNLAAGMCHDAQAGNTPKFAVMINPANLTYSKYAGRYAWMTSGYEMGNNYN
ncbi:MAG: prepilin-type N-terminal cleavage/methylation domain-containing protein [Elusimicrobiaceae bacterium]|nr:prepilin-type N-terminal cleavage/methylation domain-containing protein [Elusimicrobiaceae bacterium]